MSQHLDIIRLLIAENSDADAEVIANAMRNAGFAVRMTLIKDIDAFNSAINDHQWDLIITQRKVGELKATDLMQVVTNKKLDVPFIVITDEYEAPFVFNAIEKGADAVVPEEDVSHLILVATKLINILAIKRENEATQKEMKEIERRNELLLETSKDAIGYIHEGVHIYVNPAYVSLFGYKDAESIQANTLLDLISSNYVPSFKKYLDEHSNNNKPAEEFAFEGIKEDDSTFKAHLFITPAQYHGEQCSQVIIRINQSDKKASLPIEAMADEDLLTGLYNKDYFIKASKKILAENKKGFLMYVTLNDFSKIKEQVGLLGADIVEGKTADILKAFINPPMVLAQYSDESFVILLPEWDQDKTKTLAQKIYDKALETVIQAGKQSVDIKLTMGFAAYDGETVFEELLTKAYKACTNAEKMDKPYSLYAKHEVKVSAETRGLIQTIQKALEGGKFNTLYQPLINLKGKTDAIYEVFVRMINEQGEEQSPKAFFSAAEDAGLLAKIDRWVILHATKRAAEKRLQGEKVSLFIILSSNSLLDDELLPWINVALNGSRLPPEAVTFEINFNDAKTHLNQAKSFTKGLAEMHCKVALTHFNGDVEAFQTMHHLHVDYVRLAPSFTIDLSKRGDTSKASERLRGLVNKLHEQQKEVIVSRVEDAIALPTLWQSDADYLQGFFLAQPDTKMEYNFSNSIG